MKAEIDETGMMTIIGETPIESYALKKWINDYYQSDDKNRLLIVASSNNFKD